MISSRPGAEGEIGDALELGSGSAAGGLDGEAVHQGGEVAGEVGGVGLFGEITFGFGALETIAQGGDEGFAVADEFLAHAVGGFAAGECALDGQAAAGVGGVGEVLDAAVEEFFGDSTGGGLSQGVVNVGGGAGGVALEDFTEKGFFVAEGGVEGGAVDAHGGGEVGQGSAFVALAPEDVQGLVEGFVGVESAGASPGHCPGPPLS